MRTDNNPNGGGRASPYLRDSSELTRAYNLVRQAAGIAKLVEIFITDIAEAAEGDASSLRYDASYSLVALGSLLSDALTIIDKVEFDCARASR